ncbi:MAG: helix-turn-helix domain-containing protein [Actinobacteria bacterium]|nr:helix-turn-helix domain-containing protein [Actinomycetota bacterium]
MTIEAIYGERLGARVKEFRRRRGLRLEDLAERAGVSRAMISKVERGEKNPTLVVAAKVAEGLGVTFSELLGVEERREVVVVPRERRMVMRDPETGFERQLLSPTFGGRGVEFVRNVVPHGRQRRGRRVQLLSRHRFEGDLSSGGEEHRLDKIRSHIKATAITDFVSRRWRNGQVGKDKKRGRGWRVS